MEFRGRRMKFFYGPYNETTGENYVEVNIEPHDIWSMDYTLAHIILPMLKELKKTKHGAPYVEKEDVPSDLWPTDEQLNEYRFGGDVDPNFFKRWDHVMDEMIFAFESFFNDWEDKYHSGHIEFESKPLGPAQLKMFPEEDGKTEDHELYELVRGPNDTSEFDQEGYTKEADRIQNGFRLFGRYYQSLWN
jgi:hypothetical protein